MPSCSISQSPPITNTTASAAFAAATAAAISVVSVGPWMLAPMDTVLVPPPALLSFAMASYGDSMQFQSVLLVAVLQTTCALSRPYM